MSQPTEPIEAATERKPHYLLRFFGYDNLPNDAAREIGRLYATLARTLEARTPHNMETTDALRSLLVSRNAALRAEELK